jgi:hypothetical protein
VTSGGCERGNAAVEIPPDWAEQYFSTMLWEVQSHVPLASINENEALHDEVRTALLERWEQAWHAGDADAFTALLAEGVVAPVWSGGELTPVRTVQGIVEYRLAATSREDHGADATRYLAEFSRLDGFRLDVQRIAPTEQGANLLVRYDLRGILTSGVRRHDRGKLNVEAVRVQDGWRFAAIEPIAMERVETSPDRAPAFENATVAAGLGTVPVIDRREAIRRGGYAIAISDYDGDSRPDLLLGSYGPVALYRNTGTGFVDVTEEAGLQGEHMVKAAAFADLDNDGHPDLVLLRFVVDGDDTIGDFVAYRNTGDGRFELREDVLPRSRQYDRAMPLALADFDGNGYLDFYIGFPGSRDFTNGLSNAERPEGLYAQGIWFNEGDWNFRESTASELWTRTVYPHSAIASDIDNDGDIDLLVVDDSGRVNPVYVNMGNGEFEDLTDSLGLGDSGWSMGISAGDYDGDGLQDLVSTHVTLLAGRRIVESARGLDGELDAWIEELRDHYVGIRLYRNTGNGYEDVTARAGLDWVGDGAGSVEWIDYNSDGHLDIYVPNGLWTSGPQSIDSLFLRAAIGLPDLYDDAADVVGGSVFAGRSGDPNPMLTALRSYTGPLAGVPNTPGVVNNELHPGDLSLSIGGHTRNRLFRNNGDGTFTEVGYLENADLADDGYVLATLDYDDDGRQDLILRNTDPAPGVQAEAVTVLHNVLGTGARSISLRLDPEGGAPEGFGAIVFGWVGTQQMVREIRSTNGATQSEPVAHFGLGLEAQLDRVQVRWPSGRVEEFGPFAPPRAVLHEGTGRSVDSPISQLPR